MRSHGINAVAVSTNTVTAVSAENSDAEPDPDGNQAASIDVQKVVEDVRAIEGFFQEGLQKPGYGNEGEDEDEKELEDDDDEDELRALDNSKTHDSLQWVDQFILDTRRKGGRQTEKSVLKLWKASQQISW